MLFKYIRPIVISLALTTTLGAESWVRGVLAIHESIGEVILSELGGEVVKLEAGPVPIAIAGLINCEATHGSKAFFSTSNGSFIFFEGNGSFTIERFEQIQPDAKAWKAPGVGMGQSRMIMHLRGGNILLDNRSMSADSKFLVETPLGRVTVKQALWQMRIEFDPRSQIYDFTINCGQGRLRFTDRQGQQYTLQTGQRLAGAGARSAPSVEIGENTGRWLEQLQAFQDKIRRYDSAARDLSTYEHLFKNMERLTNEASATRKVDRIQPSRRPIIIEYAKEPSAVTPFRAELSPLSDFQADLF